VYVYTCKGVYRFLCVVTDWRLERGQKCIHFSILPAHTIESIDRMLDDLKSCIAAAKVYK